MPSQIPDDWQQAAAAALSPSRLLKRTQWRKIVALADTIVPEVATQPELLGLLLRLAKPLAKGGYALERLRVYLAAAAHLPRITNDLMSSSAGADWCACQAALRPTLSPSMAELELAEHSSWQVALQLTREHPAAAFTQTVIKDWEQALGRLDVFKPKLAREALERAWHVMAAYPHLADTLLQARVQHLALAHGMVAHRPTEGELASFLQTSAPAFKQS